MRPHALVAAVIDRPYLEQTLQLRKAALDFVEFFVSRDRFQRRQIPLLGLNHILAFQQLLAGEVHLVRGVVELALPQLPLKVAMTVMPPQNRCRRRADLLGLLQGPPLDPLRVSGRSVRFCTLSGAFLTSVEVPIERRAVDTKLLRHLTC